MGRVVSPPRLERFAILTDEKHTSTFLNHLSHYLSISWILPVGCYHTVGWTKYNDLKLMFTLGSEFVAQKNMTFETFVYLWGCGLGCHGVDPFENWPCKPSGQHRRPTNNTTASGDDVVQLGDT